MARGAGAALAAILALLASAPGAGAAVAFERCPTDDLARLECARVVVPLDRSGGLPGQVRLHVERLPARRGSRPPVLALAGGPGQAASPARDLFVDALLGTGRDVLLFDQRGTGRSGALRCPELERARGLAEARAGAEICAGRLGPARARYTTLDSVEDVEAIRIALGVPRIALLGVSYGSKVALAYAGRFPERVDRLVLDSVEPLVGPDPFLADTRAAIPRALRAVCRLGCAGVGRDPNPDLTELAARLRTGPLRGAVVDARGRPRPAVLGRLDLLDLLLAGDIDPVARLGIPAALRAALRGDPAPALRLKRRALGGGPLPEPPQEFSVATYAATTCEEAPLPWARTAPAAERRRQALAATAGLPASAFAPFDRSTLLSSQILWLCQRWPSAEQAPALTGPGPGAVPALLLAGEGDLRTPVEAARRVAESLPGARLLVVPDAGHNVIADGGCVDAAVRRFLAARAPGRCPREEPLEEPAAVPPLLLDEVPPAGGVPGRPGRTLAAAGLTLQDVLGQLLPELLGGLLEGDVDLSARGGGLRAGRYFTDRRGGGDARLDIVLDEVVYVPGVRVSGRLSIGLRSGGRLRIDGPAAAPGTLVFSLTDGVRGRLGGLQIHVAGGVLFDDEPRTGGARRGRIAESRPSWRSVDGG